MLRILDVSTSILTSLARLGSGGKVASPGARPERLLELYEFENCPFCRKAREALSILDLDAKIYPCPKSGPKYRPELVERGGKAQFPYLIDPNTGTEMYESNHIVRYLFEHYGNGRVPILLKPGPQNDLTTSLASMVRPFLRGPHLQSRTRSRPAARAIQLRSLTVLPNRSRRPVQPRDSLHLAKRRQRQRQASGFRGTLRQNASALSTGSQHGNRDVRVSRDLALSRSDLRKIDPSQILAL